MLKLFRKPKSATASYRGLVPPPHERPREYASHRQWAGAMPLSADGLTACTLAHINPILHRCRISKVKLKNG